MPDNEPNPTESTVNPTTASSSFNPTTSGSNTTASTSRRSSDHQPQQQHGFDDDNEQRRISRISVRPPPFWRENPALWFKQLESQFYTNGITVSDTKFHIAVSALDTAIISQVSDVVMNPPNTGKYEKLKQQLQNRFADSDELRFRKLLSSLTLGDRKPSHLWREMKELAGDNNVNEQMLKSLWLQRLPTQSQAILSTDDGDVDRLIILADKVHDIYGSREVNALAQQQPGNSSTSSSQPNAFDQLCEKVNQLTRRIESLTTTNGNHHQHQSRNRSRSQSRSRKSSSRDLAKHPECWYHHTFGEKATKCVKPCTFVAEN